MKKTKTIIKEPTKALQGNLFSLEFPGFSGEKNADLSTCVRDVSFDKKERWWKKDTISVIFQMNEDSGVSFLNDFQILKNETLPLRFKLNSATESVGAILSKKYSCKIKEVQPPDYFTYETSYDLSFSVVFEIKDGGEWLG